MIVTDLYMLYYSVETSELTVRSLTRFKRLAHIFSVVNFVMKVANLNINYTRLLTKQLSLCSFNAVEYACN